MTLVIILYVVAVIALMINRFIVRSLSHDKIWVSSAIIALAVAMAAMATVNLFRMGHFWPVFWGLLGDCLVLILIPISNRKPQALPGAILTAAIILLIIGLIAIRMLQP